jgi:hypothetical protein
VLLLFGANALLHLLCSPLFFKLKRPDWALVEVAFLWSSLVALVVGLAPISTKASLLILPSLPWVTFAAWLNSQIVRLNPRTSLRAAVPRRRRPYIEARPPFVDEPAFSNVNPLTQRTQDSLGAPIPCVIPFDFRCC